MIFLAEKIEAALVWAVRCKGCGEHYVTREIGAGELMYKDGFQKIASHETKILYEYEGVLWVC
jgi:hypothetical protein